MTVIHKGRISSILSHGFDNVNVREFELYLVVLALGLMTFVRCKVSFFVFFFFACCTV